LRQKLVAAAGYEDDKSDKGYDEKSFAFHAANENQMNGNRLRYQELSLPDRENPTDRDDPCRPFLGEPLNYLVKNRIRGTFALHIAK
jgi:hypothetical protein